MVNPRLLIVCVALAPLLMNSGDARAQQPGAVSRLDLTLNLDPPAPPKPAVRSVPAKARVSSRASGRTAVASRGTTVVRQAPRPDVLGKLAQVSVNNAVIRRDRDRNARVLSQVPQGTYLAVVEETADQYGVLMIDKSIGWIAKSAVRMIDYQVAVGDPSAGQTAPPAPTEVPPSVDPNIAQGHIPEGLDPRRTALLQEAFSYLGVPYVWAGNTRSGLDCSGFVKNVFSSQGVSLPRHSGDQARVGLPVAWQDLQAGDRLYFDMGNKGRVSHTGIYLGNGYFIHASSNQGRVGVDSLLKPGYYRSLVGARRS